ncbi:MAG: cupin domain-containing protein [Solirubrobacteraceae bacterium]
MSDLRKANVLGAFEYDDTDPAGYRSGVAQLDEVLGGEELAVKAFELPPGQSVCPYHYEYTEEWLLVLESDVLVRTPQGEQELTAGEIVCFAPGPAGAHKVSNRTERTARIVMFSSARKPAVAVYPDSGKIGVWPDNNDEDHVMLRREDGQVEYYDGER